MKHRIHLTVICVIALVATLSASGQDIDSIQNLINQKSTPDTVVIKSLRQLARIYAPTDSVKAINALTSALEISRKKSIRKEEPVNLNKIGFFYEQYGNFTEAERYYRLAVKQSIRYKEYRSTARGYQNIFFIKKDKYNLKQLEQLTDSGLVYAKKANDELLIGHLYNNLGNTQVFKGMYEDAMENLLRGLEAYRKADSPVNMCNSYLNIGNTYNHLKLYDKSIEYSLKGKELSEKIGNFKSLSQILVNLSSTYFYKNDFEKAIEYAKEVENLRAKTEISENVYGSAVSNIGNAYMKMENYPQAAFYLEKASAALKNTGDIYNYIVSCITRSELYIVTKKYEKAEAVLDESLALSKEYNFKPTLQAALMNKSELFKRTGRYEKAYELLEESYLIKDSISTLEATNTINELETKYRTAEKDKQIAEQKAVIATRNTWLIVLGALALLLSGFVLARYRIIRQRQKLKLQELILEQQDMAAKAVIHAEENERKRMATTLHDSLGQFLSVVKMNLQSMQDKLENDEKSANTYNRTLNLLDESIKEVRSVSHEMIPNALMRSGLGEALKTLIEKIDSNSLKISLTTDNLKEDINQDIQMVLYRIFQESINNVIKHSKANKLHISLFQDQYSLNAIIADNGVGFDKEKVMKNKPGMGLENILVRIKFLKGKFDIDSAEGKGTTLKFEIPLA